MSELGRAEEEFFETNVEGKWAPSPLTCSDDLVCSDWTYPEGGEGYGI